VALGSARLRIDGEVARRFPGYAACVISVHDVTNGPSDAFSQRCLRAAEDAQRHALAEAKASQHPHMTAWREAFRSFGMKPGRYANSAEALLVRVSKGEPLPAINRLVDLYNSVSVKRVLPVGGEDLERVAGRPTLRFARGHEPFDTIRNGEPTVETPAAGEVIWADEQGVTCRGWNWRQCLRTRLTEATRHAYFVLDRLPPYGLDELRAAGEELADLIRSSSPGPSLETELLEAR
jgi:DNA/RNA-binding domain of Phe-tRNA-synthetase-like protein